MIQTVAARAQAEPQTTFLPVDALFAGHEVCGNSDEWINAPQLAFENPFKGVPLNDQSFHPNEKGHAGGYAVAVNHWINPAATDFLNSPPAHTARPSRGVRVWGRTGRRRNR